MIVKDNVITAGEGKVLQRISDEMIFGKEIYLGYTYYLGGELLDEPLYELPEHYQEIDETPEHYEEIDDPELNEPILDEDVDMILEDVEETPPESKRVTLRDYLELEDKINKLIEHIKWQD